MGGPVEPSGMNRTVAKFTRVPGSRAKDTLRDIFGEMTIQDHAHGRRIDVINMPANEFVEGRFRAVVHIGAQKFPIGLINHILSMPQPEKPDNASGGLKACNSLPF